MHLGDIGDIGLVIADKPGGGTAEENKWLADSLDLTNHGTEYIEPDKIVLPIVTAHSHHVPHLQLADFVVATTTAAYAGRPPALFLVPKLRPLMHRHRLGYINGVLDLAGGFGTAVHVGHWTRHAAARGRRGAIPEQVNSIFPRVERQGGGVFRYNCHYGEVRG